jgi:PD-(D/E)XK nuclease superfamily protein
VSLELPVIDRPIDNTALSLFMKCPRKYDFAMRRHRRHRGLPPPAISYGAAWHKMMEIHYKRGGDADLVYMALQKAWEDHGKPDDHRTSDRCWLEYENYVKRYGLPHEEDAQTVGYPETPLVEISANVIWPGGAHAYAGRIDRIIHHQGQYYVEDHKTTSRMGDYYFKQFENSNQMMGYVWIARQLYPSIKIAGVRINAHCVLKRESKFRRQTLSFSDERLVYWAENYNKWIGKLRSAYANDDFPENYSECDGKYRMCEYMEVCTMPPKFRDRTLEDEYELFPWNPLEADEPDEAGEII